MRQSLLLLAGAWLLGGCAGASYHAEESTPQAVTAPKTMTGRTRVEGAAGQAVLQCVPYAREHSQVKLFGDAWTWWDQASGKYERGPAPASGSVMVLHNYAGPDHGHLAVVRRIVSSREIRIDHANWLNDGSIYVNNPVVDVSAANDWSQVRVFNIQTGAWGGRTYPVRGFIGAGSNRVPGRDKPAPQEAPIDALIADLAGGGRPVSVSADDRNPPAGSPFALTAQDLAVAGD
jgi:surface antigen